MLTAEGTVWPSAPAVGLGSDVAVFAGWGKIQMTFHWMLFCKAATILVVGSYVQVYIVNCRFCWILCFNKRILLV
jgi:hypothetical protein